MTPVIFEIRQLILPLSEYVQDLNLPDTKPNLIEKQLLQTKRPYGKNII